MSEPIEHAARRQFTWWRVTEHGTGGTFLVSARTRNEAVFLGGKEAKSEYSVEDTGMVDASVAPVTVNSSASTARGGFANSHD